MDPLLALTLSYLEALKNDGQKYVALTPESRRALAHPIVSRPAISQPSAQPPSAPAPVRVPPAVAKTAAPAPAAPAVSATTAPESDGARITAINDLRQRALACVKCPHLVSTRRNVVFGVGDIFSPLMFIGEAPGMDEDHQGEPFVGKAGQLLTRIIQTMGFSRDSVYIANVLKCRPDTPGQDSGNRKPTPEEMKTCLPYLLAQIDLIQPKVIVCLGGTAMEGLFGTAVFITKIRGQWQEFRAIPVMPTYHPSYLLRNQAPTVKRQVWEDMLQVLQKLGRPISEKQQSYFLKA